MTVEARLRDAAVPLRHYRLDHVKRDTAYELAVDFYSDAAEDHVYLWTSIASWMRVKFGAGSYIDVGDSFDTAAPLGAFAAGETREGMIEVKVPVAADVRHQELAINLGYGDEASLPLSYLLRDVFTTDDAAPLSIPRTCEPGPGSITDTDGGTNAATSGGELIYGTHAASGHKAIQSVGTFGMTGIGVFATLDTVGDFTRFHHDTTVDIPEYGGFYIEPGTTLRAYPSISEWADISDGVAGTTTKNYLIARTSLNGFWIINGELRWVDSLPEMLVDQKITINKYHDVTVSTCGELAVLDLPANGFWDWVPDFSTVTDSESTPTTGTTFDCDADCHVRMTWTHESGKFINLYIRNTNYLQNTIRIAIPTDDSLRLYKTVNSSSTHIETDAGVFSDGVAYQLDVVAEDSAIKIYVDNVLMINQTVEDHKTITSGYVTNNLATNDIELSTHPHPALGPADQRFIAPQHGQVGSCDVDPFIVIRNVNLPSAASNYFYVRNLQTSGDGVGLRVLSDGGLRLHDFIGGTQYTRIHLGPGTVSAGDNILFWLKGSDGAIYVNYTKVGSTSAIVSNSGTEDTECRHASGAGYPLCDSIVYYRINMAELLPSTGV